ncbi:MAG: ThiF family adenylyltransferase [Phycisphaerales bacterium JB038]
MDLARYHRQTLLPQIGEAGQRRLAESHVLIVGCGALGSVQADLLARAGVGSLVLVDRDFVETVNLQRQVLYDEADARARLPKAIAAKQRLEQVNSGVTIEAIVDDFNSLNAYRYTLESPRPVDVILDGLDNFETRYLLNDLAVRHGVPYVYGGAVSTTGMLVPVLPRGESAESTPWSKHATPCLRCLFEEPPAVGTTPTCDTAGILGPVTQIVAGLQVAEAVKILLKQYEAVRRSLVSFDLWEGVWRAPALPAASPDCPCCGRREFPFLSSERGHLVAHLCGSQSVQINPVDVGRTIDLEELRQRLAPHGEFELTRFLLRGRLREELDEAGAPLELTVFRNGRTIIRGLSDVRSARTIQAKYVGT